MVEMLPVVAVLGGADCEGIRSGWLAQPANALSSLTYVAVGASLLWQSRASGVERGTLVAGGLPMTGVARRALIAGGLAMTAVGVGSFAYHGPQPDWAHWAHNVSIPVLAAVIGANHLWLLARAGVRSAAAVLMAVWKPAAPWIVLAFVGYWAGRTGSSLCNPSTVWQPHAAWHALGALGLGLALAGLARAEPVLAPEPAAEVSAVGETPPPGDLSH
ncbi:MAG: hypothetical protein AB1679_03190 [Actinomycetota bacterium]|jgi:hypothetical protein